MKFYPIPDPRNGVITKEMLADLKQASVIPHNVGTFASGLHWIEAVGVGQPMEGSTRKLWRDNSSIWNPNGPFDYLMLERGSDGNFLRWPLNFSDPAFDYLSSGAATFYHQYAPHFPVIPHLIARNFSRYDAGRMNFGGGIAEDYPLGIFLSDDTGPVPGGRRVTFPSDMALRFNPQTGQPEAFYYQEYVKENPMDFTPYLPPFGSRRLSDEEMLSAIEGLLDSHLAIKEKADVIRQLVGR